jgi:signal transduction histidine kinase
MRFLAKINRNYAILFATVLLISSLAGYFILHHIILDASKESLLEKKELIIKQISQTGEIPNLYPVVEVKRLDRATGSKPGFKQILVQNEEEHENEPYLEYAEEIKVGSADYSLKVRQSSFENEDLVLIITLYFFIIISVSLCITLLVSRKINRTVWATFETNLETIEKYNFSGNSKIKLVDSTIEEFDRLNHVIAALTEKLSADYFALREFTENASHEIQTPLTVALLHLDEILQQDLNKELFEKTMAAIQALKRLSSLNQSLILLAKIENRQFHSEKEISLTDIIKQKLQEYEPLIKAKKLEVAYRAESDFRLKIHEQLADLLLNNLLSNAINHNLDGGSIQLISTANKLEICNTGINNNLTGENIFNRFTKGHSKSYGLGLAIVKKICDTNNLEIRYQKNDRHCFSLMVRYQAP